MIGVEDVTWTYPYASTPALVDLDLSIAPGELVALCGASGSGKSTALRLLNGLVPHFHDDGVLTGRVLVDGLRTSEVELDALGEVTGTVLQHPRRQFFADTAREEIAFASENFGTQREETRARVASAIEALAPHVPTTTRLQRLSGGQQQQVAIAAATAHAPKLVLLDEPSSNLSSDAVARLVETLAKLKAAGTTIVVAEHRLRYLKDLLDRVVVMREGRIDVEWTAAEYRRVSDDELAREGLRGDVSTPDLPCAPAAGPSIAPAPGQPSVARGSDALELHSIRCVLGGRTILDIDHAAFGCGEVTAVRGTNGTGKTTLARVVAGLQKSEGRVSLRDRDLRARARQRSTAIVMQDVQRQLFTDSVEAEVELASIDADGAPSPRALLETLDLVPFAERHPLALSGGQQQRLVVAAARVAGRDVVIFDEPSSGVDRRHLQSISDQVRAVAADGAVVILISHDEDLLALAADCEIVLRHPG